MTTIGTALIVSEIKREIRKRLELFFSFTALAIISLIAPDKALDALTEITEEEEK